MLKAVLVLCVVVDCVCILLEMSRRTCANIDLVISEQTIGFMMENNCIVGDLFKVDSICHTAIKSLDFDIVTFSSELVFEPNVPTDIWFKNQKKTS